MRTMRTLAIAAVFGLGMTGAAVAGLESANQDTWQPGTVSDDMGYLSLSVQDTYSPNSALVIERSPTAAPGFEATDEGYRKLSFSRELADFVTAGPRPGGEQELHDIWQLGAIADDMGYVTTNR